MTIQPADLTVWLRKCGVIAYRAAWMPPPASGPRSIVVFLEPRMDQSRLAEAAARRMPGVAQVTFSGHGRSIMYVTSRLRRRPNR